MALIRNADHCRAALIDIGINANPLSEFKAQQGVPFHMRGNVLWVRFKQKQLPSYYWQVLEPKNSLGIHFIFCQEIFSKFGSNFQVLVKSSQQ